MKSKQQWFDAAKSNNVQKLSELQLFNSLRLDGRNALSIAIESNSLDAFNFLLKEAGKMICNRYAIHYAIQARNVEMIQKLIDVEATRLNELDQTPLFMCVSQQFKEGVELLRQQDQSILDLTEKITPFIKAVKLNNRELCLLLLKSVDECDFQNLHPVNYALQSENYEIVELILQHTKNKSDLLINNILLIKDLSKLQLFKKYFGQQNLRGETALMKLCQLLRKPILSTQKAVVADLMFIEQKKLDFQQKPALVHAIEHQNMFMVRYCQTDTKTKLCTTQFWQEILKLQNTQLRWNGIWKMQLGTLLQNQQS